MNDTTITTPHAIAARWWADQLRGSTKQDNGDSNGLANVLAVMNSNGVGHEKADEFEAALLRLMEKMQEGSFTLSADYSASGLLSDAAKEVGIPTTCGPFPMKTVMWVERTSVSVKHGYGAKIQQLS